MGFGQNKERKPRSLDLKYPCLGELIDFISISYIAFVSINFSNLSEFHFYLYPLGDGKNADQNCQVIFKSEKYRLRLEPCEILANTIPPVGWGTIY